MVNTLTIQRVGTTVRITLNRPEAANSLSREMVQALQEIVYRSYQDGTTLLVLAGEGRHFCAGFDLSQLESEDDDSLLARFVRIELLLQSVRAAPFTTLALGHGRIMGAGADLFAACEQRWLVGDATLCFPGAAFGLVLGTGRLTRLVGTNLARDWISSGCNIEPTDALSSGLATASIDTTTLSAALSRLTERSIRLDSVTRQSIYFASGEGPATLAEDLQALVQSAARSGLKERIQQYRAQARKAVLTKLV
ncbi:MAG: enoyl-CoA hydratase/isomerase family protein [Burkholderiaceae bacterium]|nr:enoyl-CoA hydratase/isomerase family protein [Burkholderiaceae bacterium]